MVENSFVTYLNTLHNYNAQNANVFGERNISNEYYKEVLVHIPVGDFIVDHFTNKEPHIFVLTGHAGDGKTSLMYQVLERFGQSFEVDKKKFLVNLPNGKSCLCIKDFSEFSDDGKIEIMGEVVQTFKNGNYVFMVANTGPLINSFDNAFDADIREDAKLKLISMLDENTGKINDLYGLKISVINFVAVNNTFFAGKFLNNVCNDHLWTQCSTCNKQQYCPIARNIQLLKENSKKVIEFVTNHYRWVSEYGERLTIRSMTQHLSFMITGGLNCEDVTPVEPYMYLSSNLFFGYKGPRVDDAALAINSVSQTNKCNYEKKRFRVDEDLFISNSYKDLFSPKIENIIIESKLNIGKVKGWDHMIKRMYMFYNTQLEDDKNQRDSEDIFSKQFKRYVDLKYYSKPVDSKDHQLVRNALSMLNLGVITNDGGIPITLSRESGYVQTVQYIVDTIKKHKIKLVVKPSSHTSFLGNESYNDVLINVDGEELSTVVNLPLFDYFEDLKNGIINTNIDAQLSKGVENMKSEVLSIAQKDEDFEEIKLIVTSNDGFEEIVLDLSDGTFRTV